MDKALPCYDDYCIGCEHCKMKLWSDYYPVFHCTADGQMDARSTKRLLCTVYDDPVPSQYGRRCAE